MPAQIQLRGRSNPRDLSRDKEVTGGLRAPVDRIRAQGRRRAGTGWERRGLGGRPGIDRLLDLVITLHVAAVTEDEALEALLKGRHAYATVHRTPGEAGASQIARIVRRGRATERNGSSAAECRACRLAVSGERTTPPGWPSPTADRRDQDRDPSKPPTKAKGAPVSTKAPKPVPVPPRKRPQR